MGKIIDLKGKRFGRLFVLEKVIERDKQNRFKWECRCDCGKKTIVRGKDLKSNNTQSCGCLHIESVTKHGMSRTLFYSAWKGMLQRCNYKESRVYENYGGRGIKVCKRWLKFEQFFKDMGNRPKGFTLERINNNGNYEPNNCKWATIKEQNSNKRPYKKKKGYVTI